MREGSCGNALRMQLNFFLERSDPSQNNETVNYEEEDLCSRFTVEKIRNTRWEKKKTRRKYKMCKENQIVYDVLADLAKKKEGAYKKGAAGLGLAQEIEAIEQHVKRMINYPPIEQLIPSTTENNQGEGSGDKELYRILSKE